MEVFNEHRSDIKKEEMSSDNYWYATEYAIDIEHEHLKDPEVLKILNKVYSIDKPLKHTKDLLKRGDDFLKEYKINVIDLLSRAERDFAKRYNDEYEGK